MIILTRKLQGMDVQIYTKYCTCVQHWRESIRGVHYISAKLWIYYTHHVSSRQFTWAINSIKRHTRHTYTHCTYPLQTISLPPKNDLVTYEKAHSYTLNTPAWMKLTYMEIHFIKLIDCIETYGLTHPHTHILCVPAIWWYCN
jgi:hypothetical protein